MTFFTRAIGLAIATTVALTPSPVRADRGRNLKGPRELITIDAIEGAATDCSEYQYVVGLADDVKLSYVVTDATFSAKMELDGEAWVAIAISDEEGEMIGSEAIIGLPAGEPNGLANPGKYHMNAEKVAGVFLRDQDEQTLSDGSVTQEDGKTTMTFTKKLKEEGEIEILSEGQNYFVWAYGFSNVLGLHDEKTGTGFFYLDVAPCIPSDATDNEDSETVEDNVEEDHQGDRGEGEEEEDGSSGSDSTDVVQDNPVGTAIEGTIDCSEYQNMVEITDKLTMSYVVNDPTDSNSQGSLSVKMEYDGEAWIAFGTAANPNGKMIGSEAIIALPDKQQSQNIPRKYHMTAEDKASVYLMDPEQQTLRDATITQEAGKTIMTFTKELVEPNELAIVGNGDNTFLWAVGFNNNLNLHLATGAFRLPLTPCTELGGGTGSFTSVESGQYSTEQTSNFWTAHAYMGLFAWAVFAPAAIAISWLRKLLQNQGPLWFKLHMYLNIFVVIFTLTAFGIAVSMYKDADKTLFQDPHGAMGLVITILVTLQAGAGIFRPAAPSNAPLNDVSNKSGTPDSIADYDSDGIEVDSAVETGQATAQTAPPSPAGSDSDSVSSNANLKSRKVRAAWEATHKLLGLYLLGMGLWQVQDGIVLYATKFNTELLSAAFWGAFGGVAFLVLALTVYMRVREVN